MKVFYDNIKSIIDNGYVINEEQFRYKKGSIYWYRKNYWQMIGILSDDVFLIRSDNRCIRSFKLFLKTFKKLNHNYKLALCDHNLDIWGIKGGIYLDYPTAFEMIVNLFHYYSPEIAMFFKDNDYNFIDMLFNTVHFFEMKNIFEDIINDDSFWKDILNVHTHYIYGGKYTPTPKILKESLEPGLIRSLYFSKERGNIIKDLLD